MYITLLYLEGVIYKELMSVITRLTQSAEIEPDMSEGGGQNDSSTVKAHTEQMLL